MPKSMKYSILIIVLYLLVPNIKAQDTLFVYKQNALAFKIPVGEVDSICLNKLKLPLTNKVKKKKELPQSKTKDNNSNNKSSSK
jgi:hypothetical protein